MECPRCGEKRVVNFHCSFCGHYFTEQEKNEYAEKHKMDSSSTTNNKPPFLIVPPVFKCPFCGTNAPPRTVSKTSTAGWIFFILFLFCCFPLSPLALLEREHYKVCNQCGIKLG